MTTQFTISPEHRNELLKFLKKHPNADAVEGYCAHIEQKLKLKPMACPREKVIGKSLDDLIQFLDSQGKISRETEHTFHHGKQTVNVSTVKVYICPFCHIGIGNNMDAFPADRMYDHVSKCSKNTTLGDGVPLKSFSVSEDPEMIAEFITERKASVKKIVHTVGSKVYSSKEAVLEDFKKNQIKPMTFYEVVLNPREFEIEKRLSAVIEEYVNEEKIIAFLETLSKHPEFEPYVKKCQEGE